LPQVRCPRCGAVNDTRAPDYPFCVGCQDNLAKCGYCTWFDDERGECTNPAVSGLFEVNEDATPPCGYHSPRASLRMGRRAGLPLVWVAVAAAVFALAYAVTRLLGSPPADFVEETRPELELSVEGPAEGVVAGQECRVEAVIYNTSRPIISGVRLEVARESLERAFLRQVVPAPSRRSRVGKWEVLAYPPMNPLERRRIGLTLVPKEAGIFYLTLRLVSGESADVEHGIAELPIDVRKPPRAGEHTGSAVQEGRR